MSARSLRPPDPVRVRRALLRWFSRQGRRFFWRDAFAGGAPLTDYQVLLTEFLLWKTAARAEPTIEAVVRALPAPADALRHSRARLEEDLRPLGLQRRRAACLLAFSQQIVERHDGRLPRRAEELRTLTGIGQYAARATACVLHGSRLMPVDANTIRVFGRLYGEEGPGPRDPGAAWDERFDAFVPRREPRRFLWAVMDLAALICVPREPRCEACPLRAECVTGRRRLAAAQAQGQGAPAGRSAPKESRPRELSGPRSRDTARK